MRQRLALRIGQYVTFKDTPGAGGVIFEFQDEGMVAGLNCISEKLKGMGVEGETWEGVAARRACSSHARGSSTGGASCRRNR